MHWVSGGSRDPDNLVLLCPGHHCLIHRRNVTLVLHPDGAVTARGNHRPPAPAVTSSPTLDQPALRAAARSGKPPLATVGCDYDQGPTGCGRPPRR
ncbi:MAG: hypothetical protein OEY70_09430 [Acidimicrobiia bacterium]|nr:hypothetical protein [Acidimicrobiia bacterium]